MIAILLSFVKAENLAGTNLTAAPEFLTLDEDNDVEDEDTEIL